MSTWRALHTAAPVASRAKVRQAQTSLGLPALNIATAFLFRDQRRLPPAIADEAKARHLRIEPPRCPEVLVCASKQQKGQRAVACLVLEIWDEHMSGNYSRLAAAAPRCAICCACNATSLLCARGAMCFRIAICTGNNQTNKQTNWRGSHGPRTTIWKLPSMAPAAVSRSVPLQF